MLLKALGKHYSISGMSFIKSYIKMTTSIRFILSSGFKAHMDSSLDKLSKGFLHVVV